jgi:hypothetical protein
MSIRSLVASSSRGSPSGGAIVQPALWNLRAAAPSGLGRSHSEGVRGAGENPSRPWEPRRVDTSFRAHHSYRETTIWPRRSREHTIRDERDFGTHIDYIHFNPVKHGLVKRLSDWPFSTFHLYLQLGTYRDDWGGEMEEGIKGEFGE